jgi:transposase
VFFEVRGKRLSKVELYEKVRLARRDEGLSIRALAARFEVHRREVRAALMSPEPAPRKVPSRSAPVTGAWHAWIREVLVADRDAPRKQRHTAKRIRDRLAEEKGVLISESQCRVVVARIRTEIAAEAGTPVKVFVPQTRLPGAEGEVDWGKFDAVIGGETVTLHLFSMWLAFSTNAFHRAYVNEAQESFTDAHVRAFERFEGVPRRVRYDNLKTAVVKILQGRDRTENERFIALRSHYGFESFFCEPGIDGAHEKGGVEGDIGWFRRNHLTPVPTFDTLADLNDFMEACDTADGQRWVTGRGPGAGDRVHSLAALERPALWVLPPERFAAMTRLSARVDTKARVCVRQCFYSVPARLVGQRVTIELGAEIVTVIAVGVTVAAHARGVHRRSEHLDLDHYLEVLWRRPGALPASTALAQARTTGRFRSEHQQFWDLARRRHGDKTGTRALCDVLLLHRHHHTDHVVAGIRAALSIDSVDPGVVAVETRRAIEHLAPEPDAGPVERIPDLSIYDQLLTIEPNPKGPPE